MAHEYRQGYCDCSRKVFATVDVNILLAKLPSFGITGMEHKWFEIYFSERSYSVSVDGHPSDPPPGIIGVLQGSILGPLLFVFFLNDLPTVTESSETNLYAGDTDIDSASKPDHPEELKNNLNSECCNIREYFNINRLSLNVSSCCEEHISHLQKCVSISIHINNQHLHKVTISKYIAMCIDSNLKWDDHINMIPKISAKIGILRSLRNIVPTDTLIQIYNAIVQPHLCMLFMTLLPKQAKTHSRSFKQKL